MTSWPDHLPSGNQNDAGAICASRKGIPDGSVINLSYKPVLRLFLLLGKGTGAYGARTRNLRRDRAAL
jgi:hypothetical protein